MDALQVAENANYQKKNLGGTLGENLYLLFLEKKTVNV